MARLGGLEPYPAYRLEGGYSNPTELQALYSLSCCSIQLSYGQVLAEDDSIELLPIHHQYHGFQDRLRSQPQHLPI